MLQYYTELASCKTSIGLVKAWQTSKDDDPSWDSFLNSTPGGQFEQTGLWAQTKKLNGWSCLRVVLTCKENIIAGFQILMKTKQFIGKIGYISKGPVVAFQNNEV